MSLDKYISGNYNTTKFNYYETDKLFYCNLAFIIRTRDRLFTIPV